MQRGLLEKADCTYAANRMLAVLGLDGWDDAVEPPEEALESPGSHFRCDFGLGL